ncbi:tyrosine-type recombinase/integrase [Breoghania sp.]|uniref:tyrosine-type recombinase/integrase n=1 Tax=Breoghania sp. TaxID=2065378 RepID=UPI00261D56A8|nr:tyrosine-type recombinase/integrase [Breoghania sp.]MDJ0933740.1 tyrosine-type recombinase/integrase [Breoghania sp.]
MIFDKGFEFLTEKQISILYKSVKSPKMLAMTSIMLDAGLRVSEALSLQVSAFNFRENFLRVQTLKQKSEKFRDIPMTERLYNHVLEFFQSDEFLGNVKDPDFPIFATKYGKATQVMTRQNVWAFYKNLSKKRAVLGDLHPHTLRHTFATRLVNKKGVTVLHAKELLGHRSISSTEVYSHVPKELLEKAIEKIDQKHTFWGRVGAWLFGKKSQKIPVLITEKTAFLVGRTEELRKVSELVEKNVNCLILGTQGVGKTLLMDNLTSTKTILKIDDLKAVKQSLHGVLMFLLNHDKKEVARILFGDMGSAEKIVSRYSVKNYCDTLKKITKPHECIIAIDNVSNVSTQGVEVLEFLRSHFVIVAGGRKLPLNKATFATNFEMIDLGNLNRRDSLLLIERLSLDVKNEIEDYELFSNHIIEQTNGNPQFIYELINRYRAEKYISVDVIRNIRHTAGLPQFDMTIVVIIGLASLMILRYYGRAVGDTGYQIIGAVFLVFALIARQVYVYTKRKFL